MLFQDAGIGVEGKSFTLPAEVLDLLRALLPDDPRAEIRPDAFVVDLAVFAAVVF